MSGLGEFAGNWLRAREAELGLELSRSRERLGARVLISILQIKQSTTHTPGAHTLFEPASGEAGAARASKDRLKSSFLN